MRLFATFLALVALIAPTAFARELSSIFVSAGGGADHSTLDLYSAVCSEDPECLIARFVCGEYHGLSFVMGGFSDKDIGKWFSMNGATAILKSEQNILPMKPIELQMDDLSGTWVATFLPSEGGGYGDGKVWLRSLSENSSITVMNVQDDMLLPVRPNDKANISAFVSACLD